MLYRISCLSAIADKLEESIDINKIFIYYINEWWIGEFKPGKEYILKKASPSEKDIQVKTELRSKSFNEEDFYKERIIELVELIENPSILKRIYQLAEYLYILKEEKE